MVLDNFPFQELERRLKEARAQQAPAAPPPAPVPPAAPVVPSPEETAVDDYGLVKTHYENLGLTPPTAEQFANVQDAFSQILADAKAFKPPPVLPTEKETLQKIVDEAPPETFQPTPELPEIPEPDAQTGEVFKHRVTPSELLSKFEEVKAGILNEEREDWVEQEIIALRREEAVRQSLPGAGNPLAQMIVRDEEYTRRQTELIRYAEADPEDFMETVRLLVDKGEREEAEKILSTIDVGITDLQREFLLSTEAERQTYFNQLYQQYMGLPLSERERYAEQIGEHPAFGQLRELGFTDEEIDRFFMPRVGTAEFARKFTLAPDQVIPQFEPREVTTLGGQTLRLHRGLETEFPKDSEVVVDGQRVPIGDVTEFPFAEAQTVILTTDTGTEIEVTVKNDYTVWKDNIRIGNLNPNTGEFTETGEGYPEWLRAFTGGIGDLFATAGGTARWLGQDGIGATLSKQGAKLQQWVPPDELGEFNWDSLWNPRWWTTRVPRFAPTAIALMAPAIAAFAATGGVAAAAGLGRYGTLLVQSLAGGTLARSVESMMEAGGAHDEALARGLTSEQAKKAADDVFKKNMTLVGADVAQFALAFGPTPQAVLARLVQKGLIRHTITAGKIVAVGLSEAGEEIYQEIIQRQALGDEIEWDAELKEVASIGGVMGLGLGGLGSGVQTLSNLNNRVIENLPPDLQNRVNDAIAADIAQGIPPEAATMRALDTIAEVPEAQAVIEEQVEIIKKEEAEKELKFTDPADEVAFDHIKAQQEREAVVPAIEEPVVAPVAEEVATPVEASAVPVIEVDVEEVVYQSALRAEGLTGLAGKLEAVNKEGLLIVRAGDSIAAILGDDLAGVADELGLDTVTQRMVDNARKQIYDATQASLKKRGLPDEFVVWRAGEILPDVAMPTSLSRSSAKGFSERGAKPELKAYIVNRADVLADIEAFGGGLGILEEELLVMGNKLRPTITTELAGAETVSTGDQLVINNIQSVRDEVFSIEGEGASTSNLDAIASQLKEGSITTDEANARFQMEQITKMAEYYQNKIRTQEQTRKALTDYIKGNLPLFGKRQQSTMLTAVKNVRTEAGMQKVIARVNEFTETNTQKTLTTKIESELAKVTPRKQAGIPRGKFTPETQAILDPLKANLHANREDIRAKMEQNVEAYNAGKMTPEALSDANLVLSLGGIDGMTSAELQNVLDEVREIKSTGRLKRQEQSAEWQAMMGDIRGTVLGDVTGGREILPEGEAAKTNVLRQIAQHQLGLDEMINELARRSGAAPYQSRTSKWAENIHKARQKENLGVETQTVVAWEAGRNIFRTEGRWSESFFNAQLGKISDEVVDIGTFTNTEGRQHQLKMTKGQTISAYHAMQDPTLDATLREGNLWTDEMMEAVTNSLSTQEKAWADWMLGFYQRYWQSINEVYSQAFHVNLGRNVHYSPISREAELKTPEPMLLLQENQRYATTTNGSLKARVPSTTPLRFHDANKVLMNHIIQMEHFKAWTDVIRQWRSVFMNPEIRQAIRQVHGQALLNHIDNYIEDLARGGIDKAKVSRVLDGLRRNFTIAVLGIKPAIAIKQLPSALAYSTQIPVGDFYTGVANFWLNPLKNYKTLIENSPSLRTRFGGAMERDIALAMNKGVAAQISRKGTWPQKFMLPIRMMDKFAVVQGSWAVYRSEIKKGATQEQAILKAEIVTQRTQPSFNIESLSPLQNGQAWWKLATMFQNQPNKYWRIYYTNAEALITGNGGRAKAGYNLFLAWVVLPAMFQFMADAFQWKEKHQLRAALLGPLNFLLAAGGIVQSMTGWMTGETFNWGASPAFTTVDEFLKAISKGGQLYGDWQDAYENVDMDDIWKLLEHLGKAGGQLTGLPTPWLIQAERGIRAGAPEELIFSRWSLEKPEGSMYEKSEDVLDMLGELLPLEEGQFEQEVFDMNDWDREMDRLFGSTLPEDVIKDKGASAQDKAHAEQRISENVYNTLPDKELYKVNTEVDDDWTILDYYKQWQGRERLTNLADLKEYDKLYPNSNRGNVTRRQYDLMKQYLEAEDKDAFLEANPELKENPQNEWLRANPVDNARLALVGDAKIMSQEAYALVQKMIEDLDFPDSAVLEYLPPADAVESYFDYNKALEQFSPSSAEVMILRAKDENLQKWGADTLGWGPVGIPVEKLELIIANRDIEDRYNALEGAEKTAFLQVNPDYADDRQRIDAYTKGFSGDMVETHVEYGQQVREHGGGSTEVKQWLKENEDYHQARFDAGTLTTTPEDLQQLDDQKLDIVAKWRDTQTVIDNLADKTSGMYINDEDERAIARQKVIDANPGYADDMRRKDAIESGITDPETMEKYVQYWQMPTVGGEQELYLHQNPDLAFAMGKDLTKLQSEREYEIDVQWAEEDAEYATIPEDDRSAWLDTNFEYHQARRERDALENDVTHVDDYIDWYTVDRSGEQHMASQWEEEWWLIEHQDFNQEMIDLGLWTEKKDFSEVPNRAIAALVEEYWTKEKGASRVTFRENNPALNVYFHLTSGYSLLGMDLADYNVNDIFATGGVGEIPVPTPKPEVTPSPEKVAEDEAKTAYKALRKTIGSGIDKNQTEWVEWASQQGSLQEAVDSYMTWFREGVFN